MQLREKSTIKLLAALYLCATFLPAGHEFLFEPKLCTTCQEHAAAGPSMQEACDDQAPCSNREHHHHPRGHDHKHCPLCQYTLLANLVEASPQFRIIDMPRDAAPAWRDALIQPFDFSSGHPTRAPPQVS